MTADVTAAGAHTGRLVALVLAAGRGRRFAATAGSDKLLVPLADGRSVLEHALAPFIALGIPTAVVTTNARAEALSRARAAACGAAIGSDQHIDFIATDSSTVGLGTSLALGTREISRRYSEASWLMLSLGDLPSLATATVAHLQAATLAAPTGLLALRPVCGDALGHPVVFHRDLWAELRVLSGDHGARGVWASLSASERALVPVDDRGVCADIDLPGDLHDRPRR